MSTVPGAAGITVPPTGLPNRQGTCYLNAVLQWYQLHKELFRPSLSHNTANGDVSKSLVELYEAYMDNNSPNNKEILSWVGCSTGSGDSIEQLHKLLDPTTTHIITEHQHLCTVCGTRSSTVTASVLYTEGPRFSKPQPWGDDHLRHCLNCRVSTSAKIRNVIMDTKDFIVIESSNYSQARVIEYNIAVNGKDYELQGMIMYRPGHYWSMVRYGDRWYDVNDMRVEVVSPKSISSDLITNQTPWMSLKEIRGMLYVCTTFKHKV